MKKALLVAVVLGSAFPCFGSDQVAYKMNRRQRRFARFQKERVPKENEVVITTRGETVMELNPLLYQKAMRAGELRMMSDEPIRHEDGCCGAIVWTALVAACLLWAWAEELKRGPLFNQFRRL